MHRIFFCALLAVTLLTSDGYAQNKNQRDKQDEKQENERVERAQKSIRVEQQQLQPLLSDLRAAMRAQGQAEKELDAALAEVRLQREAAEERLEEKSGFPELLRKQRELRAKYALVTKPIIERVHSSSEWISAKKAADQGSAGLGKLTDDDTLDEDAFAKRRADLNALITLPQSLEAKAIELDVDAKVLDTQIEANAAKLAVMRKTFDDGKVLSDPRVKSAIDASQKAKQALVSASEKAATVRSKISKQQASIARAIKELADAKQADAKDRNQPKPPGKNK